MYTGFENVHDKHVYSENLTCEKLGCWLKLFRKLYTFKRKKDSFKRCLRA